MADFRVERDSMGEVNVPSDRCWGPQTQRSLENFAIGTEKMPVELIRAFALTKKAAALTNFDLGKLPAEKRELICAACDEISAGRLDVHFPLAVWQTGSGTQTNMNVNEVIANYANGQAGSQALHPNDDVNMSQSSNDTFPTAMHVAAVVEIEDRLLPALRSLAGACRKLEEENPDIIKIGRTHLQDAVPIKFAQEVSGWRAMLEESAHMIELSLEGARALALGGTAVGTGLNAPAAFGAIVAEKIGQLSGKRFITAKNKFHALTSKDALVFAHGALKALAADLMKIANDIRLIASGPRCGLGEISIPENEPGSSIMPGKVNPTQCEAVTMVACQVIANDVAVGFAASQGNLELNVFMPVCIYNFLQSVRLLSDVAVSFEKNCVSGITVNAGRMEENLGRSLMLVTALNPYIGYDNAAKAAKLAHEKNISLREAVLELGLMTAEKFDEAVRPEKMV